MPGCLFSLLKKMSDNPQANNASALEKAGGVAELTADELRLQQLGYKQELKRELNALSVIGIAMSCEYKRKKKVSTRTDMIQALNPPLSIYPLLGSVLSNGGPQGVLIAWPVVFVLTIFTGLSMSEIQSAFPISGGVM